MQLRRADGGHRGRPNASQSRRDSVPPARTRESRAELAAEAGISADVMRMPRDRSAAAIRGYWRQLEFSVRTACAQSAVETVRFRLLLGDTQYMKTFHRASLWSPLAAVLLTILLAVPAYATCELYTVSDRVRNWVAGLLAEPATLFLTIGGDRSYLPALIRRVRQSVGLQLERAA